MCEADLLLPPGRRIAVVGAAGGIGRWLVDRLLVGGAEVAALDLAVSLRRHPPAAGVLAVPLDATDEPSVVAAFSAVEARFGALDGLVNLVGFASGRMPVAETAKDVWDDVVAGNLTSAYLSCRYAMPLLRLGRQPAIVNTASGLALKPTPGYGPYSAAKAGVLALTRLLAQEGAPQVRANAVAPSAVDTAFLTGGTGRSDESGGMRLDLVCYEKTVPLGRIASPADIAGPILFLLGPASAYVTGQTLHVNGGLLMV